jgi:hypothetical protein
MPTAAYFRRQAQSCLRIAQTADPRAAEQLKLMAADFMTKAVQLETGVSIEAIASQEAKAEKPSV